MTYAHLPLVLTAVALMALTACASGPEAPLPEMAVSTEAVSHALSAGGTESAPTEMRSAQDKLDRAKVAVSTKDYEQARTLAKEAQVDALLAEAKAHAVKARKAADELQESRRVLREEINRKTP
jgi:multidrug efflux pump subunit AcrA (membrane-fusion protein)